ncbi:MAG: RIO1 family regulatory kinase/ATPase [Halanaeroarchaeum sp.]
MSIRRVVRGTLAWDRLETVAREVAARYDQPVLRMTFLEADNWLSTPCVVNDEWFVKIVSPQNAFVHALFTGARNVGAFTASGSGFFEHTAGPVEMAEHELEATRRMRDIGLHVPEPIEAFEVDGLGVVVLEYLEDFVTLDELPPETVADYADDLFAALSRMHDNDLAHGDLREENVLVHHGHLYFIDATNVDDDATEDARAYDVACALAALEPHVGAPIAVHAAAEHYSREEMLEALNFLAFVNLRPDHDFDSSAVTDEVTALPAED